MPTSEKEKIIEVLKSYPKKKKQIDLLRYELEHSYGLTESELIEALSLGRASDVSVPVSAGNISDRTVKIALHYEDIALRMKSDTTAQIIHEQRLIEAEINRIAYYVATLDPISADVIRCYYFEEKSWTQISEQLHMTQRALMKHRDNGVNELVKIFEFLTQVKTKDPKLL